MPHEFPIYIYMASLVVVRPVRLLALQDEREKLQAFRAQFN